MALVPCSFGSPSAADFAEPQYGDRAAFLRKSQETATSRDSADCTKLVPRSGTLKGSRFVPSLHLAPDFIEKMRYAGNPVSLKLGGKRHEGL